jgi:hypothetical protein
MALQQSTLRERASLEDIVRVLLIVAAVIVVMLALNVVFGFNGTGPWTGLTPDPGRPF